MNSTVIFHESSRSITNPRYLVSLTLLHYFDSTTLKAYTTYIKMLNILMTTRGIKEIPQNSLTKHLLFVEKYLFNWDELMNHANKYIKNVLNHINKEDPGYK